MNNEIIIAMAMAIGIVDAIITATKIPKVRYAFIVPEGYAGLLYQKAGSRGTSTEESGAG